MFVNSFVLINCFNQCSDNMQYLLYVCYTPINVNPEKGWGGGFGQGAGICVSDPKFLSNDRGSGVEKSSNEVEGPHPGNTK